MYHFPYNHVINLLSEKFPKPLQLERDEPGIGFGKRSKKFPSNYIGVAQAADSNIVVIGGAGANKTVGVAMTTIQTWKGAMVVTDVKGELSAYYKELYRNGLVDRPPLVFDPTDVEGLFYDPFQLIEDDGEANVVSNISSIAYSIIPENPNTPDQFWDDRERSVLAAGLLYGYHIGLSFSETMCWIANSTVTELCEELSYGNRSDPTVRMLIGNMLDLKPETLACFDSGLRNKEREPVKYISRLEYVRDRDEITAEREAAKADRSYDREQPRTGPEVQRER